MLWSSLVQSFVVGSYSRSDCLGVKREHCYLDADAAPMIAMYVVVMVFVVLRVAVGKYKFTKH